MHLSQNASAFFHKDTQVQKDVKSASRSVWKSLKAKTSSNNKGEWKRKPYLPDLQTLNPQISINRQRKAWRVVGVGTGFSNFLYTGVEKYKRYIFPHPAYIYFIKMPANPDNPSRFVFFPPWRAVFLVFQNALVFKSKRTCVSSQTSLRFKSNALAF